MTEATAEALHLLLGGFLWFLLCYPIWSPRCRRIRRAARVSGNRQTPKNMEPVEQDWLEMGDDLDG